MQALKVRDSLTLVFTTVMDELSRGLVDDDEDAVAAPTDRAYWEKRATKSTVGIADQILQLLHSFDRTLNLKYNKFYIGLERDGRPYNFVQFRPKKNRLTLELNLPQTGELDTRIDSSGLDTLEYDERWARYRLRLTTADVEAKADILRELAKLAYDRRASV